MKKRKLLKSLLLTTYIFILFLCFAFNVSYVKATDISFNEITETDNPNVLNDLCQDSFPGRNFNYLIKGPTGSDYDYWVMNYSQRNPGDGHGDDKIYFYLPADISSRYKMAVPIDASTYIPCIASGNDDEGNVYFNKRFISRYGLYWCDYCKGDNPCGDCPVITSDYVCPTPDKDYNTGSIGLPICGGINSFPENFEILFLFRNDGMIGNSVMITNLKDTAGGGRHTTQIYKLYKKPANEPRLSMWYTCTETTKKVSKFYMEVKPSEGINYLYFTLYKSTNNAGYTQIFPNGSDGQFPVITTPNEIGNYWAEWENYEFTPKDNDDNFKTFVWTEGGATESNVINFPPCDPTGDCPLKPNLMLNNDCDLEYYPCTEDKKNVRLNFYSEGATYYKIFRDYALIEDYYEGTEYLDTCLDRCQEQLYRVEACNEECCSDE